jgi:uncharacterized OsmC-like protein
MRLIDFDPMAQEGLNGVRVEKLTSLIQELKENPEKAAPLNKWAARVKWIGGFRNEVRAGGNLITSDEPEGLGGTGSALNPAQLLLAAVGTCLSVGLTANATAKGIKIDDLEIETEGRIDNILTFLGLSEKGHPGYKDVKLKVHLSADAPPDVLKKLLEYSVRTSPFCNTVVRKANLTTELHTGEETHQFRYSPA